MTKLADRTDIPTLEGGWINLTEAAERLGLTRAYMYKLANGNGFSTIRRVGKQSTYVVNVSEVEEMIALREKVAEVTVEEELAEQEFPLGIDDIMAQL